MPEIPWYLQRPDRPAPATPAAEPQRPSGRAEVGVATAGNRNRTRVLVGVGVLAVVVVVAVAFANSSSSTGGTALDVNRVQAGVQQTLSDPASGYGANTVTSVTCNGGRNPSAAKGTTFTCDATVNGTRRHVTVLVADDNGTYEVDGPR